MIGFNVPQIEFRPDRVEREQERTIQRVMFRIGGIVRATASRSIRRNRTGKPSPAGKPPRTRNGLLRRAIRFKAEPSRRRVVIGPSGRIAGPVGGAHELGGRFRGERFDARPFMRPAVERNVEKIRELWQQRG